MSLSLIGGAFGGKDHTTIIHSINKIKNRINNDKGFKNIIDSLSLEIKRG